MKLKILLIVLLLFVFTETAYPCNSCGGGTSDLVVLALDGKALINLGLNYDKFLGSWDQNGVWHDYDYNNHQYKTTLSAAYRLSRHLQFGVSVPYVFNTTDLVGVKSSGSGIGDIAISGRYEFFHEFQLKKKSGKSYIDKTLPYLALTFGLTLPTGRSEETAENDVDITGKGYYISSLGVSLTKTLIRNKLQLITDLSWQHSFPKTYESYYGQEITTPYDKTLGDKINYGLAVNYIINNDHAIALSASGFTQSEYVMNGVNGFDSAERSLSFSAAYTYYPTLLFRITPSVKWVMPSDNTGRNATGSLNLNLNLTYYFPDFSIN